jgi:hypothetical protein
MSNNNNQWQREMDRQREFIAQTASRTQNKREKVKREREGRVQIREQLQKLLSAPL